MMNFLVLILSYLSNALEVGIDSTNVGENKHLLTGFWLVLRYEPELLALAAKSTTPIDDKVVSEILEVARKYWPAGTQAEPELPDGVTRV